MQQTIIKRIKLVVICFYLLLIAGLAVYDENPKPELKIGTPFPLIIEPGNAWLAFLGFDAPQGISPYACGEERIKQFRAALDAGKKLPDFVEDDKSVLLFKGKLPTFSTKKGDGILAYALSNPDDALALVHDNEELLERYQKLCKYPHYNEPTEYGFFSPVPKYLPIKQSCQVKLLKLASLACGGETEAALISVQEDAEFWRVIAQSSNTLISKLVAFSILKIHFRFATELGTSHQLNDRELAIVKDILRPFDKAENRMAKPLRGEACWGIEGMKLIRQQAKPWDFASIFLYKPNATANRCYGNWQETVIRFAEMTPQQFVPEMKRRNEKPEQPKLGIPFLYNPLGEIMWVWNLNGHYRYYLPYMELGHDLEGIRRLFFLKVLCHTENVPLEGMQQFLDSQKTDLGNPYTGNSMTWNSNENSISFSAYEGRQPSKVFL